jgi:sialate O-acetylesterase
MRRKFAGCIVTAALAVGAWCAPAHALVGFSETIGGRSFDLFGDHMVLQRDVPVPVWGRSYVNEPVTVTIGSQTRDAIGDSSGRWRVVFDPFPAGGPYEVTATGPRNSVTLTDVMFGDVFLMAGQSNLMIKRLRPGRMAEYPNVRVFKRNWQDRPGDIPWNFGRELNTELGIPIGVLQRGMRGSSGLIRTWLGPDAVNTTDPTVRAVTETSDWGQSYAAVIGNVAGFAIKGVIWWQGEADRRRSENPGVDYGEFLREVIRSWRVAWDQGAFPFHFLQEPVGGGLQPEESVSPLPPLREQHPAALLRQAYIDSLSVENTAVITSSDLVDGLHPRDREGYCSRIVASVLGRLYGYDISYAGPTFESATLEAGGRIRIRFREGTALGLHARGGPLQGFEVTGAAGRAAWGNVEIQGDEVVVWADSIPSPLSVRYGYDLDYTFANLFNEAGMGAPTFVTTAQPFPE